MNPSSDPTNKWHIYDKGCKIGTNHIYIVNSTNNKNEYIIGTTVALHEIYLRFEKKYERISMEYKIVENKRDLEHLVLNVLEAFRQSDKYGTSLNKHVIMNKGPLKNIIDWCIDNYSIIVVPSSSRSSYSYSSSSSYQTKIDLSSHMLTTLCIHLIENFHAPFPVPMDVEDIDGQGSSYAHNFSKNEFTKIVAACG